MIPHTRSGAELGGVLGAHAPFFTSHFFREMFINRGATHLTLGLWLLLSQPFYQKYTCAPLTKLPSCAPVLNESVRKTKTVKYFLKVSSEVVQLCSFERTLVAWICFWILTLFKVPIQVSLFIKLLSHFSHIKVLFPLPHCWRRWCWAKHCFDGNICLHCSHHRSAPPVHFSSCLNKNY